AVAAGPWPAQNNINTNIVEEKLLLLQTKFPVTIDFYCFMPDHMHVILALEQARRGRAATNLSWVINALKGWCTRTFHRSIFQPNFYEHIIRDENSLERIRKYILYNPLVEYGDIPWKKLDPEM
ncbi:transposase, partial [Candidatus Roizmanbacteria bacterium]|nr:transposase [Candidatus Roizmanbacteria bacterium]